MPTIIPDTSFATAVFYHGSEGNSVFLRVQMARVYELRMEPGLTSAGKLALGVAWGFLEQEQIADDLIAFGQFLASLPMFIPAGYSLPNSYFLESPFSDPEWFTFGADYFLYCVFQRPAAHINTGYDAFPPSLYAEFVLDAILEYRKDPKFILPPVPLMYESMTTSEGWTRYYPDKSKWGGCMRSIYGRTYIPNQWYTYYLYPEFAWLWNNTEFDRDWFEKYHALSKHGIRSDAEGRLYYYGTDEPSLAWKWPYKSISPLPPDRKGAHRGSGSWTEFADWQYYGTVSGEKEYFYPPQVGRDINVKTGKPPRWPILREGGGGPDYDTSMYAAVKNIKLYLGRTEFSGVVDGSWKVGFGGISI